MGVGAFDEDSISDSESESDYEGLIFFEDDKILDVLTEEEELDDIIEEEILDDLFEEILDDSIQEEISIEEESLGDFDSYDRQRFQ